MDKTYIIYKHTSPSGKCYIGQTCETMEYRSGSTGNRYWDAPKFYNAIKKYGWDNFIHEVLLYDLTKEDADYSERQLIAYYKSLNLSYNLANGGEGGRGFISKEERKYMSERQKGKIIPEETKRKMSESHRLTFDRNQKGALNPMYGKPVSEETIKKRKETFLKNHPNGIKYKRKTLCVETNETWNSIAEAARALNISYKVLLKTIKYNLAIHNFHFTCIDE